MKWYNLMHVKLNVEKITSSHNNIKKLIPEYLSHYYRFMHIKCDLLEPIRLSLRIALCIKIPIYSYSFLLFL